MGICDSTYVAENFANCKNGDSKRNELRLWQTNSSFFFFPPPKIGACLVTRSLGFFLSCTHPAGTAYLMMACNSKELRIKKKTKKMIHDRWRSLRDARPAWCFILALMDFALQSDTPVACPRQFSYREDSRRFILMTSLLLCLLQLVPLQFLWRQRKSTHVKINVIIVP